MILNMSGAGAPGKIVTVHVSPGTGATVTCSNDKKTYTATTDSGGNAIFKLTKGPWTITAENQGASQTLQVAVTDNCTVNLSLEQVPAFTYTGDYEIVSDSDGAISSTLGNWKIRFLTSGTLKFTALNGAENGIDVFLVGGGGTGGAGGAYGGGGGGGGGYTKTEKSVAVSLTSYDIIVGASGGNTSAFGIDANAGSSGGNAGNDTSDYGSGGSGGSGGGKGGVKTTSPGGDGGFDGSTPSGGGSGQSTTTREFGEDSGKLYAGGGGGGTGQLSDSVTYGGVGGSGGGGKGSDTRYGGGTAGTTNTGGGGGGGGASGSGGSGGSGIVIIRNAR